MNVGAHLRQARESRGLAIATLASTTRIHPRVLEAIERNDLSVIPPQPYARGFVAAFAREVGLNPDEIVREYFARFDEAPSAVDTSPTVAVAAPETREWRGWMAALGAVVLVVALGALFSRRAESPRMSEPTAPGTSGAVATSGDPTLAASNPKPASAAPASNAAAGASDVGGASGIVVVVLETDAPSWVAATVDGRRQVYQILPEGTKTTLRGTQEISLRVGNAGGVRWSVDGREAVPMGRPGEVRDVKLTPRDSHRGR